MNTMGGTCSSPRRCRKMKSSNYDNVDYQTELSKKIFCRHSNSTELPDESISALYPVEDNYVVHDGGSCRSPKPLVELCTDAVCRNLPNIEGDLPSGIPQDLVDDILASLVSHSALNATTLRALRKCEIVELPLSRCRGVSDDWLTSLNGSKPKDDEKSIIDCDMQMKSNEDKKNTEDQDHHSIGSLSSSSDSTSFHSAVSTPQKVIAHSLSTPFDYDLEKCVTTQMVLLDLRGSQRISDKGLLQLKDLRCLEVARLGSCYSIVGKGLLAFSNSHRLHTLSLSNCRCLTDEAIINISHLTSITVLSLDGCRCITDIALDAISNLHNLQKLELSQCDLLTDSGLQHLHSLGALKELSLGWCRLITDKGIEIMSSQPNRGITLENVCLARCRITDEGVGHLSKLLALRMLDLNGCSNIGSLALGSTLECLSNLETLDVSYCPGILRSSWQGKINSLRSIDLCYSGVKNAHLSRFTSLPSLEEINLDSCPVGDWSMAHFADNNVAPNLKSLDLADSDVTDRGLSHITKMKNLKQLSLFYCDITNDGLRHLSSMESLEILNLDSRDIGDSGIFFLRNLKNLKCLDVFSGRITDLGCSHIAEIESLESLELCGGGVGNLGCIHLSRLENLTSLNLSQNERITNAGASSLSALSKLKALNLSNTRVTADTLPFFKGLVELQSLAMYGCRGVQGSENIHELQRDLPNLKCIRLNESRDGDGTIDEGQSEDTIDNGFIDENDEISFEEDSSDGESNVSFFAEDEGSVELEAQEFMSEEEFEDGDEDEIMENA